MFYILLIISLLFIAILIIKTKINASLCALCLSISITWLGLLFLYKINHFNDLVLLSLLIGQSITGIYYYAINRLPKALRIFSLPFFLSLTVLAYIILTSEINLVALLLVSGLWIVAWLIFVWRNDPGKKSLAKVVANCCEDLI